jgi:hypothetical protein
MTNAMLMSSAGASSAGAQPATVSERAATAPRAATVRSERFITCLLVGFVRDLRERSHKSCYNLDSSKRLPTTFGDNGLVTLKKRRNKERENNGHRKVLSANHR